MLYSVSYPLCAPEAWWDGSTQGPLTSLSDLEDKSAFLVAGREQERPTVGLDVISRWKFLVAFKRFHAFSKILWTIPLGVEFEIAPKNPRQTRSIVAAAMYVLHARNIFDACSHATKSECGQCPLGYVLQVRPFYQGMSVEVRLARMNGWTSEWRSI